MAERPSIETHLLMGLRKQVKMLYDIVKLDEQITAMKKMAVMLIPYSHPKVQTDDDVSYLKLREIIVDGYYISVSFSRADYDGLYADSVNFTGKYMPFLPMNLVCKLGKKFLGDKELSLKEVLQGGRKYYAWVVLRKKNSETAVPNSFAQNGVQEKIGDLSFTRYQNVLFPTNSVGVDQH